MANETAIEWTDITWNFAHGCSVKSPGCAHCYAAELSLRYGHTKKPWTPANAAENVLLKPHKLREPLGRSKAWRGLGAAAAAAGMRAGKLVFVNSMSDLFHEQIPFEFIAAAFGVMAATPQHTFQILTKRPERALEFFKWHRDLSAQGWRWERWRVCEDAAANYVPDLPAIGCESRWPLDNVWMGVSIENRRFVDRAELLKQIPASTRFISAEPLLGPVVAGATATRVEGGEPWGYNPVWSDGHVGPELDLSDIDWLIAGGESGRRARPMDLEWVRDVRDAAQAAGTAFFVKQLGGARPGTHLEELPPDLRIREWPATRAVLEAA